MPVWTIWYVRLFWPCLAVVTALCLWKGDRPTRMAATIFTAGMVASKMLTPATMFVHFEVGIAIVDTTLALALTALCVTFPRPWLILLAATQIIPCLGHITRALGFQNSRLTYAILTGSAGYPAMILLLWGLIASARGQITTNGRPA